MHRVSVYLTPARVLVIGFAAVILIGSILLTLPVASQSGQPLRFLDALFTATSAVCVTGLLVVDTGAHFTRFGQLVIITLVQIGGLGIMTFSTLLAMLLGKKIGLKERILIQESMNQFNLAGLVKLIRSVLLMTLAFEGIGGVILSIRFMFDYPVGQALAFGFFHSISSFCNAGFDLFGPISGPFTSITRYANDWVISLTIGGLIIFGGLGFPVIVELFGFRKTRRLSLHSKLVLTMSAILVVAGALLILLFESSNAKTIGGLDFPGKVLTALFQSIAPRSAGYSSLDMTALQEATWFILIMLMFIGASSSSTGGGIKVTTFGILVATIAATIRGKEDTQMFERRIGKDLVNKSLTITMLALGWVTLVTLLMSLVEPHGLIKILFEVVSSFGTVGLTTGITTSLTDISRILIIITMFIGRLGPLTIAVALAQWDTCARPSPKYIEDRVIIG